MADLAQERPCIHVCLIGGAAEALYRWVEVGAEEEGVPTRKVPPATTDLTAAAYAAAQGSRFDIGLSIAPQRIVLHETHMPPLQPVLSFELGPDAPQLCRLMGSNAARLVVRLPLRFKIEDDPPLKPPERVKPPHLTHATRTEAGPVCPPPVSAGSPEIAALARAIACKSGPLPVQPKSTPAPAVEVSQIDPKMVAQIVVRILRERGLL